MKIDDIFIVAEIGCNHNGDPAIARKMIDIAAKCGVDAVKFQTFNSKKLISKFAPKAEYQKKTTGIKDSQLEMTQKLELPFDEYVKLHDYAKQLGLEVFSTAFDLESIDVLVNQGQKLWKIPSGELTNLPYLEAIAQITLKDKKLFLSTGMSTLDEVQTALTIFESGTFAKEDITILHCNTEYPTPYEDVNLNVFCTFQKIFHGYKLGFSDHSQGYFAAIASVPYGVSFIEKHFTLDKNLVGPDHKASVSPDELKILCQGIRAAEKCLGLSDKKVTGSERKNKIVARKSIVAARNIKRGEKFTVNNITTKRPGNGISPMSWYKILGREAERDFMEDELIQHSNFIWQSL